MHAGMPRQHHRTGMQGVPCAHLCVCVIIDKEADDWGTLSQGGCVLIQRGLQGLHTKKAYTQSDTHTAAMVPWHCLPSHDDCSAC
jgi:hypothetical protein